MTKSNRKINPKCLMTWMTCFVRISCSSFLPNQEAGVASREGGANLSPDFSGLLLPVLGSPQNQWALGMVPPAVPPAGHGGSVIVCVSAHVSVPVHTRCSQGAPSTARQLYNCGSLDVRSGAAPDSLAIPAARRRDPTGRLPLRGQMSLTNRSMAFVYWWERGQK